jgi:hypothetical protein
MLRPALALALSALAVPATAASHVMIRAGESLTVRINGSDLAIVERGPAPPLSPFEAESLQRAQGIVLPPGATVAPPVPLHTDTSAPTMIPGQVRITLRKISGAGSAAGPHSLLTIENGYGQSVMYRAVMHQGDRSSPTDVCEVIPGRPGFEHWPYEIDWLDLSQFELSAFDERKMRCQ